MFNNQKHIVKKQVYNISVETQQNSHIIHKKISEINNSIVLPLINKACCELNVDGSNIRIDNLEIDIDGLKIDEFDSRFEELFYSKFYEKLSHEIAAHVFHEAKDGLIVKSPDHTKIEKIEYYLISGLLPWWHSKDEDFDISSELNESIERYPDQLKAVLLKNSRDPRFSKRISYLLTPLKLKDLLKNLFPSIASNQSDFFDDVMLFSKHKGIISYGWQQSLMVETILSLSLIEKSISTDDESVELVQNLILGLCDHNEELYTKTIDLPSKLPLRFKSNLPEIINQLKSKMNENLQKERSDYLRTSEFVKDSKSSSISMNSEMPENEIVKPDIDKKVIAIEEFKEQVFTDKKSMTDDLEKNHKDHQSETLANKDELNNEDKEIYNAKLENLMSDELKPNKIARDIQPTEDLSKIEGEDIYINNAGLVLLWPFLERLFVKMKFYSADGWSVDHGCDKAIQLLQYMAIGSLNFKEHELPLNKILCGSDIFYPVQPEVLLVDTDLIESDSLIGAAIANWSALKNTSVEGFRSSFLVREGRLTLENNGWRLYIERKGYDVLLDRLPWAISVVKNKWMPKPIYTEW